MNKFEAVVLFNPSLSSSDLKKQEDFIKNQLNESKGTLIAQEDWGLRDLSYKITNFNKAFYKYFQLEIEGNKIQNIKKNINQNEQIIRHMFIKVENHEELPTKIFKEDK